MLLVLEAVRSASAFAASQLEIESQIKAAFLARFLGYVEMEGEQIPIAEIPARTICIYGDHRISAAMEALERIQRPEEHKTAYRNLQDINDAGNCSLLFIGSEQSGQLSEIVGKLKSSKIVTVSDIFGFASKGGMIELIKDSGHIRFILNRLSAKDAGVKFGAQLLSLAKEVIDQ
jgi:hypothetical protein